MRTTRFLEWYKTASIVSVAMLMVLAMSLRSSAEVKPGDFITKANATKVQDLLSPGVYYKVEHGMSMKIVPTERVDWPPPYKDATEKYSGQVRLTDDHRSLVGYVAGQPFPLIDPNDPYAGTKIVWNLVYKPFYSDDYDLRFYDGDTEYEAEGPQKDKSSISRSVTTWATTWWAAPRSSRFRSIRISR